MAALYARNFVCNVIVGCIPAAGHKLPQEDWRHLDAVQAALGMETAYRAVQLQQHTHGTLLADSAAGVLHPSLFRWPSAQVQLKSTPSTTSTCLQSQACCLL